jgi:hypothetical protein
MGDEFKKAEHEILIEILESLLFYVNFILFFSFCTHFSFLLFIYFIIHLFTCTYIVWLISLSCLSLLGIYPKECNTVTPETPAQPCLLQQYSQQPSYGNNQDAPLLMNGSRKCGTCTQWNFTQP